MQAVKVASLGALFPFQPARQGNYGRCDAIATLAAEVCAGSAAAAEFWTLSFNMNSVLDMRGRANPELVVFAFRLPPAY
jgi:hypothetical protein